MVRVMASKALYTISPHPLPVSRLWLIPSRNRDGDAKGLLAPVAASIIEKAPLDALLSDGPVRELTII
jgi:hypothetical protein